MKKYVFIVCAMIWAATTLYAQKGYEKSLQLDTKFGLGDFKQTYNVGITMTNGYRFSEHFMLGANVGIAFSEYVGSVDWSNILGTTIGYNRMEKGVLIPLSAIVKYNFAKKSVSPYISANVGYTFNVKTYVGDSYGLFVMPAFGIDFDLDRCALFLQLNFDAQQTSYTDYNNALLLSKTDAWTDGWFKSLGLSLGICF
ncbi:hypothetical protein [Coprobacter secundus]|uniref:Outer membrane protein beta-barrel domain-containing protein n=1 Tax=Coprobacter secundus subsp. similis TaxID=2751153 RepID=A0A7G1HQ57_9BACT|nr:hypothetical protein [Coprobacter secundus]BCI61829.1 hypothetical protein Cop2CBH44_01820 [Coprobacter secundus subsp. similis]